MRRCWAIVRATVLETTSEPLALLLTVAAVALVVLATVFSFHQFGEPTRFARDAGLSALLVFGLAYAVFSSVRGVRREIESGTVQMALAHPVSRSAFLLSKVAGVCAACAVFDITVFSLSEIALVGMEVGSAVARLKSDLAVVWTPAVAAIAAVVAGSLAVAAVLNAFARFRFTTTAVWLMAFASPVAAYAVYLAGGGFLAALLEESPQIGSASVDVAVRFIPAAVSVSLPAPVFAAAAAAFAVRLRDNAATALCALLFAVSLPALGNYYQSEALANGGVLPWGRVAAAWAATLPFFASFAVAGLCLFHDRDVG